MTHVPAVGEERGENSGKKKIARDEVRNQGRLKPENSEEVERGAGPENGLISFSTAKITG